MRWLYLRRYVKQVVLAVILFDFCSIMTWMCRRHASYLLSQAKSDRSRYDWDGQRDAFETFLSILHSRRGESVLV